MSWSPLIGQKQAIELLEQAIQHQAIAPAYLFAGTNGVGRTLAAKCFCKQLLSSSYVGTTVINRAAFTQGQSSRFTMDNPHLFLSRQITNS